MKKLVLSLMVVLLIANFAFASGRKNAGCGLGAMIIGDTNSLLGNLGMTFSNGLFSNQTFGITSGTSGCERPSKIVKNEKLEEFVVANLDNLAKDIAVGKGETLDSFSDLLNISKEERPAVYAKLHNNFNKIFTTENVQMAEVVDNIITILNN